MRSAPLLTAHARVLLLVYRDPDMRLQKIASEAGTSERHARRLLTDLEEGGYLTRVPEANRNRHVLHLDTPLQSPLGDVPIGVLLSALLSGKRGA